MTKCICTVDTSCTAQLYEPPNVNDSGKNSIRDRLMRLAAAIGEYAVEVYRYNNDPEPVFSNGATRIVIRPGRIDLV